MEQRTMRKVSARLIPFLIVCYFVAYLDRTNVGFAALTMRQDLNISATAYGFGAGIFFLSYFLFEVPSNLFLERFGARRWIAASCSPGASCPARWPSLAANTASTSCACSWVLRKPASSPVSSST
jgi:MFS family permease